MQGINRRQTLIGLGALAGGAGAIVGSGAFTTVEAQRDVEIETAGDSAALLRLEPAGTGTIVQDDGDTIGFDVDADAAEGVNQNARTTFRPALAVTNNGENDVGFYVADAPNIGLNQVLDFEWNDNEGVSIVGESQSVDISSGDMIEVDLVIDLIGQPVSELEDIETVTLVADQDAHQG